MTGKPGTVSAEITEAAKQGMTPEGEALILAYYSTPEDTGEFIFKFDCGEVE